MNGCGDGLPEVVVVLRTCVECGVCTWTECSSAIAAPAFSAMAATATPQKRIVRDMRIAPPDTDEGQMPCRRMSFGKPNNREDLYGSGLGDGHPRRVEMACSVTFLRTGPGLCRAVLKPSACGNFSSSRLESCSP